LEGAGEFLGGGIFVSGSSVGAMVVGTVFIMVFGMATVSLIDNVNQSIKNSDYELPDPKVDIISFTDSVQSPGPVNSVSVFSGGTGYSTGGGCTTTTTGDGTGLVVSVTDDSNAVDSITVEQIGSGYEIGDQFTIAGCGNADAVGTVDSLHEQIVITIKNMGSENVLISDIWIILSETTSKSMGIPFSFDSHYSGGNNYFFPGEQFTTDPFPLDNTAHGFSVTGNPNRAFLSIYDHNSFADVNS
tara:strand:- start:2506 stop:3237 length:732 start_codon:yes stop_codon:yes gene_type:complete